MASLRMAATTLKHRIEYVTGSRDDALESAMPSMRSVSWGVWWGMLLYVIVLFCGQTSKFIYIDF